MAVYHVDTLCPLSRLGDPVQISVKISNNSVALRQIAGKVVGKVVRYNGAVVQNFMSLKFSGVVNPGQGVCVCVCVRACVRVCVCMGVEPYLCMRK